MNTPGGKERVPIPVPGEEEAKTGGEQPASIGVAGPEQQAPTLPKAAEQKIVTSPVPPSVEAPVGPTKIGKAAPAETLSIEDVSDTGLPGGSRAQSELIRRLNVGLESNTESGSKQE